MIMGRNNKKKRILALRILLVLGWLLLAGIGIYFNHGYKMWGDRLLPNTIINDVNYGGMTVIATSTNCPSSKYTPGISSAPLSLINPVVMIVFSICNTPLKIIHLYSKAAIAHKAPPLLWHVRLCHSWI